MKKILTLFFSVLLILSLSMAVSAADSATGISVVAYVGTDESCQVTVTANLHIENNQGDLRFPVPLDAESVTLNGSRVRTTASGEAKFIDLSSSLGNMVGDFTITVQYTLPDVVEGSSSGKALLRLPLLSGFEYPVSRLDFTVTLPGTIEAKPAYSSGYHQANIEKDLSSQVENTTVTGCSLTELKDHETLTMTLSVDESMFPDAPLVFYSSESDDTAILVCAALALVYWLLFLRALPPRRRVSATVPAGATAGHMGPILTLCKADLTMIVFSWAQMGYILIQADRHGRVLLHKRMEMGNERSGFEQRVFRSLFGKRSVVDTSGTHYAGQCRAIRKMPAGVQPLVRRSSGNPRLFRAIAALCGLFGGISVGIALTEGALLQGFLVFLIALLGLVCGYMMQGWAKGLFLRDKTPLYIALSVWGIWMILSIIAGQAELGMTVTLIQLIAGLMAFYGGRRTDVGREEMSQVLGLRRYLRTLSQEELSRLCRLDPEFFHSMAPYALALGVDRSFARRFGKKKLPGCPWLTTGMDGHRTAAEWQTLMRQTAQDMDRRYRQRHLERFTELLSVFKK